MGTVNYIAEIVASVIDVIILERFLYIYFGRKKENIIGYRIAFYILLFSASYWVSDYYYLQGFLFITILFGYTRLVLNGKWKDQLLVCFVEYVVTTLVSMIVIQLIMLLFRFTQDEMLFADGSQRFISICINRLAFILTYFICVNFFGRKFKLKQNEIILSLIYFLSAIIISALLIVWTAFGDNTYSEQVIACMISTLLIVTTFVSMFLIDYLSKKNELDLQNQVLKSQVEMEKSAIHNLEREYSRVKILKHDMNKQLNIYLQLLNNGDVAQTVQCLQEQIDCNSAADLIFIKGNNLISAVLSEKNEICKKNHIRFDYEVDTVIAIDQEMDIAIMIANLLDNAIEAEMKQDDKNILIQIFELKSMLNIIVKNHIKESVLENNPELHTNKENTQLHGYGMKSIKATTSKLNGMFQCFEDHNEFTVHIILLQNA